MTERDTSEESQRTDAPRPTSRAELEGVLAHISAIFGEPAALHLRLGAEGVDDPSHVNVVVTAAPAQIRAEAGQALVQTEGLPSTSERDVPVQRDDAYYDEVRRAVGRGTPSVLLGTSTRSLERSFQQLKASQKSKPASVSQRRTFEDNKTSPPTEPLPKRVKLVIRLLRYLVTVTLWYIAGVAIYDAITSHASWSSRLNYVLSAVLWSALAVGILIPKFRAAVAKWAKKRPLFKDFFPIDSPEQWRQVGKRVRRKKAKDKKR
jgi:hypothetical protein